MRIPLIDEQDYRSQMEGRVLPALARCRVEGWMDPARLPGQEQPSGRLHYLYYDSRAFDGLDIEGAVGSFHGTIVISHGFTEFAEKYSEMVWYFLLAGYSVCVLEHRGHGHSIHDIKDPSLVWIDDWRRYVADLAKFSSTIGQQYADESPLYLYAHSMGGGIGAALLEEHPDLFDKAVLSSPMIAPDTGVPNWLARVAAAAMCTIGQDKRMVPGHAPFCEDQDLSGYEGASAARVSWYHRQRLADTSYQTNAATFGWLREALRLSRAIMRPEACGRVETPSLLFQAGRDTWVRNGAEDRFAKQVTAAGGNVELVRFADSAHEIFSMPNRTLEPYLQRILGYFQAPTVPSLIDDE
ncbi:lysophospholipase [Bifidobacterium aemilianum]|uniref:Lysophospholipase n=1 Tax=Bifidobacterium aemilianum TaxID=2493120 RepID=A0A366K7T7_9BIFI|nr:alpha/beta hydrolase [Bifidobacterium aemilianum]RBP97805.1 lysophospholipase [Bifidobacterium aemilianum]